MQQSIPRQQQRDVRNIGTMHRDVLITRSPEYAARGDEHPSGIQLDIPPVHISRDQYRGGLISDVCRYIIDMFKSYIQPHHSSIVELTHHFASHQNLHRIDKIQVRPLCKGELVLRSIDLGQRGLNLSVSAINVPPHSNPRGCMDTHAAHEKKTQNLLYASR